jgi:hypothetical protein
LQQVGKQPINPFLPDDSLHPAHFGLWLNRDKVCSDRRTVAGIPLVTSA